MFSWQLKELIQSSLDGIKLKQETDKIKKSFVVKPHEIPEQLKQHK